MNDNETDSLDYEAFVKAFVALDMDYFESLTHEDARWKNPGLPAIRGRERVFKILRRLLSLAPQFELALVSHKQVGNTIHIERDDILTLTPNLVFSVRVTGIFTIEENQVVYWREKVNLVNAGIELVKPITLWPFKAISSRI